MGTTHLGEVLLTLLAPLALCLTFRKPLGETQTRPIRGSLPIRAFPPHTGDALPELAHGSGRVHYRQCSRSFSDDLQSVATNTHEADTQTFH